MSICRLLVRKGNSSVRLSPNCQYLPAVKCPRCNVWGGSQRLRVDAQGEAQEFLSSKVLPLDEWQTTARSVSSQFDIAYEDVVPGAIIGLPLGESKSAKLPAAVSPYPGVVWINENSKEILEANRFSGLDFCRVEFVKNKTDKYMRLPSEIFWELVISGRYGVPHFPAISLCDLCGRRTYSEDWPIIEGGDDSDKEDFFYLDGNPNVIFVSSNVARLIDKKGGELGLAYAKAKNGEVL